VRMDFLLKLVSNWRGALAWVICEEDIKLLRPHERTRRPLGDEAFLASMERKLGRVLRGKKPSPKARPPKKPGPNRSARHSARNSPRS
jgi:hypothetical protein